MKKITLIALGALALTACNNSYKISGTTAGDKEGTMAYLVNTNTNEAIDSCVVADSAFAFAGELAEPEILRVQIGRASGSILVEPTSQISIDFTQSPAKVADNGGINGAIGHTATNTGGTAGGDQYDLTDTGAHVVYGDDLRGGIAQIGHGFYHHEFTADQIFVFSCGNNASHNFSDDHRVHLFFHKV